MPPPHKRLRTTSPPPEEEETTDLKLALLSSVHPSIPPSTLLDLLLTTHGSVPSVLSLLSHPRKTPQTQSSLTTFLTAPTTPSLTRRPKKGSTLRLYSPAHFTALTPTTLLPSFLPPTLATPLLQNLLTEATTFPPKQTFNLFDRAVVSPHTTCFYLRNASSEGEGEGEYSYQGSAVPETRVFTGLMEEATALVEEAVNKLLEKQGWKKGMMKGRWGVNAALVNCYKGGRECVGWHSDQLTYLGPMAVIASLSLGCAREFRVRRVCGSEGWEGGEKVGGEGGSGKKDGREEVDEGVYSLYLPHNSLLIMHAGMQESWKHSIHPATSLSLHPVAGNVRINITYRCFRESLRPEFTPRCRCGEPTILRCRFKGEREGKYLWCCNRGYRVGEKGCGFGEGGRFDEFGEPVWGSMEKGGEEGSGGEEGVPVEGGGCREEVEVAGEEDEDVAELFRDS